MVLIGLSIGWAQTPLPSTDSFVSWRVESDAIDQKRAAEDYLKSRFDGAFTMPQLREALEVIYAVGKVQSIELFRDGTEIVIYLIPFRSVQKVDFVGNMSIKRGELLDAIKWNQTEKTYLDDPKEFATVATEYYQKSGFPEARVEAQIIPGPIGTESVVLQLDIDEGSPLRVAEINIEGTFKPLTSEQIKEIAKLRVGMRHQSNLLRDKAEKLRKRYRKLGYLTCEVDIQELMRDQQSKDIRLNIDIQRGPLVNVEFKSNRYFFQDRDSVLLRTIDVEGATRLSRGYMEEAAERLTDYYKSIGYNFVSVTFVDKYTNDQELRTLKFLIEKGPRTKIRSLTFRGNATVSTGKLRQSLMPITVAEPFDEVKLTEAMRTLKSLLQEIGYHDAPEPTLTVNFSDDRRFADVIVNVLEGPRYQFGNTKVTVEGPLNPKEMERLIKFKEGNWFNLEKYRSSIKAMKKVCVNAGYKFCEVDVTPSLRSAEESTIDLRIKIITRERVVFGELFVEGNKVSKDVVILREITFKPGDIYSPKGIEASQRAIQKLGFFLSVQISELSYIERLQRVDLVVRVREKRRRNIRFRPGVGSDEGARGALNFSYLNLFGTGRNIYLSNRLSHEFFGNILEWSLGTTYLEPHLFKTPIDGRVQFSFQREQEQFGSIDRTSFFVGGQYDYRETFQTLTKWEIEFREPFNLQVPQEDLSDFDESRRLFGSLGTRMTFDFRDNPLNPRWGYLGQITGNYYAEEFLSEEEFYQVFSRNSFYLPL